MSETRYPCPCCAFLTLSEEGPGTFEICPVCRWEDDRVQFKNPSSEGGANQMSLEQARASFLAIGAKGPEYVSRARKPHEDEIPH